MDFTRLALGVGIDKDSVAALAKGLGKFRGELMAGDDFNILAGEGLGKQTAGMPAKRIVTPQWVAVTDNKSPGSEVRTPKSAISLITGFGSRTFLCPAGSLQLSDSGLRTSDFGLLH
jgi:hypothetical protein